MSVLNVIKVTAAQYEQINTEEGYTTPDGTTYKEGDGNLYVVYGADLTAENMSAAWAGKTVSGHTLSVTNGVINLSNPNSGFALTTGDNGAGLQLNGARGGATQILTYDNPGICTNGTIATNQTGTLSGSYLTKMDNDGVTTTGVMQAQNGFFQTSDVRKKNFISDVDIDFESLKTIPKKYFEWKDNPDAGMQIGTSAQAIRRVYPEVVSVGEDGFYSVDYSKLSIVALAAIDKLNERISVLESEIKKIKAQ